MELKQWTVGDLIEEPQKYPRGTVVHLEDADTNWTIPKFGVEATADVVWLRPCDYGDMFE